MLSTVCELPVLSTIRGSREHNAAEVGAAEGVLLEQAPIMPWSVASPAALDEEGCVHVPSVISPAACAVLRAHAESERQRSLAAVASGEALKKDHFGNILARSSRCDLKLELTPVVRDALAEALVPLAPLIRGSLQSDEEPVLAELGAIYSTSGAPRQPLHADTRLTEGRAQLLTAFVALQDVHTSMGPTTFLPGTHRNPAAHAEVNSPLEKAGFLRAHPIRLGTMAAGDCTLYDSRILHSGGASHDARGRWLLYFGFAPSRPVMRELRGSVYEPLQRAAHTLSQLERERGVEAEREGDAEWEAVWGALLRPRGASP